MPSYIEDIDATPLITDINTMYVSWLSSQMPKLVKRLKDIKYEIGRVQGTELRTVGSLPDLFLEAKRIGEILNECKRYGLTIPS